jgi:hypothetical protein
MERLKQLFPSQKPLLFVPLAMQRSITNTLRAAFFSVKIKKSEVRMQELGKVLIVFGIILAGLGLFLIFMNKIPFIGKLPGDIFVQKKNFTFYFPITTSILTSIVLSLLFWLWSKR